MAQEFFKTRFRDTPIRLSLTDLTSGRLREMKHMFGESYGIPTEFIGLLLRGEVDALACAVWIGQQKAGKPVDDPRELDFNLDEDFQPLVDPEPAKPKGKGKGKTAEPNPTQTPDSAATASKSSEADTSSTSPTSAD
jgi:hypothetical protein